MGLFGKIKEIQKNRNIRKGISDGKHRKKMKGYVLDENSPFTIVEAFRKLKASLSVAVPRKTSGGVSIMVTSSYPEDGKTTVSVNLALMFAMSSNAKVIVVDSDIRKGRVAHFFRQKSAPGLSEYLSGQASLDGVIRKSDANKNLDYIASGTHSPKPYELLESDVMRELDKKLREKYDYVIYDTSPMLLVSDALAIAQITDGTVIVCRHMRSYMSDLSKTINTLKFSKINILGVVVNDYQRAADKMVAGYKKYYNYSRYSYSYGSTSPEQDPDEEQN